MRCTAGNTTEAELEVQKKTGLPDEALRVNSTIPEATEAIWSGPRDVDDVSSSARPPPIAEPAKAVQHATKSSNDASSPAPLMSERAMASPESQTEPLATGFEHRHWTEEKMKTLTPEPTRLRQMMTMTTSPPSSQQTTAIHTPNL